MISTQNLAEWIFAHGGPVLRLRTAIDLLVLTDENEVVTLRRSVLASAVVQRWLVLLGTGPVHHSKDSASENALGKLLEYGLRAGVSEFDIKAVPLLDRLQNRTFPADGRILAPFMVRAGYLSDPRLADWCKCRLDALDKTAQRGDYDIYLPDDEAQMVSKAWRGKPIYKAVFDPVEGEYPLPTCYDLYALAHCPHDDVEAYRKINRITAYLGDERFQATRGGYVWNKGKRRCYAAGRVFLACWEPERTVLCLYLMARFQPIRQQAWFRKELATLESYRTTSGTYCFPSGMLPERTNNYYLYSGAHMGLGENRRTPLGLELESTFWMLLIQKRIEEK